MGNENSSAAASGNETGRPTRARDARFRRGVEGDRYRRREAPLETTRRFDLSHVELKERQNERKQVEEDDDEQWIYYDDDVQEETKRGQTGKRSRRRVARKKRYVGREDFDEDDDEEWQQAHRRPGDEYVDELEAQGDDGQQRLGGDDEEVRDTRIEGDPLLAEYSSDCGHSPEKMQGTWAFTKALGFFLFMYASAYIVDSDYAKRVCVLSPLNSGDSYCLDYKKGEFACVGLQDTRCFDICTLENVPLASAEGCVICESQATSCNGTATTAGVQGQCYTRSAFEAKCLDRLTCLDTSESAIKRAIVLIGLVCALITGIEVIRGCGLFHFSTYNHADFHEYLELQSRWQVVSLIITKNGSVATQVMWCCMLFAILYLVVVNFAFGSLCTNAVTTSGAPYAFPDDSIMFTICTAAMALTIGAIGTWFRFYVLLRGELARVSWDHNVRVPLNLDCADIRDSNRPRCFSNDQQDACRQSVCKCRGFGWIPTFFAWTLECACLGPLAVGGAIGWVYRYRHYIGP